MATSIIKKAAKTLAKTDAPVDLSRRSLFKLPAVSEPSTLPAAPTPAPSGLEALERVAQAPVSRRGVLKSAAGQAARAAMPSGLEALAAPIARQAASEVAKQTVAPAASLTSPLAVAIKMLSEGKPAEDIANRLGMNPSSFQFLNLLVRATDPSSYLYGDVPVLKKPSEALAEMTGMYGAKSPFALRPELRQLKLANPDSMKHFIKSARGVSDESVELAREIGLEQHWIDKYLRGEIKYEDLPKHYQDKIDDINDGFDSYAGGGVIKKAAKAAVKELGEDVRIDRRNMFRFPQKDQPLMEIPKGAPTVTEKTLEVAPEGVKGQKVTKSVIDTPVSRRTVIKSAGSQAAQRVMPKLPESGVPQVTAKDLFGSAKSMPDLYASMLPLVRKVAPEELASMADRLGFTIDDIIAMSGEDLLPRGDLTMEGLTRFEELFPITASRVLKKAGGGVVKKAAQAAAKAEPKEQKMLQGFYRGYSGDYDAQRAAQDAGMVFVTPQRPAGEYFANKRAKQTGLDPHLEMVLADPFVGYSYGLNIPIGPENKKVSYTKARQLKPEDVKSSTRLYAEGGAVAGSQLNGMVSNAMKNGMSEAEALRQLLPLFK